MGGRRSRTRGAPQCDDREHRAVRATGVQRSVMLIAVALTRVPAIPAIDALILADRSLDLD